MSVGVKHSDGNLNSLSEKYGFSYNNNINVTNYDFINNLNVQATPTTKLSLGLNASIKDWKGPNASTSSLFASTMEHNPVDYPVSFLLVMDMIPKILCGGIKVGAHLLPVDI